MFFLLFQVIASVLQIINKIIKDNTDFQENACLIGLVSAKTGSSHFFYWMTKQLLNSSSINPFAWGIW